MSYITIHSDHEDGTVNNILQQDIIFPQQSKVALVNLNVELIESVLKLDENVTIRDAFKITGREKQIGTIEKNLKKAGLSMKM